MKHEWEHKIESLIHKNKVFSIGDFIYPTNNIYQNLTAIYRNNKYIFEFVRSERYITQEFFERIAARSVIQKDEKTFFLFFNLYPFHNIEQHFPEKHEEDVTTHSLVDIFILAFFLREALLKHHSATGSSRYFFFVYDESLKKMYHYFKSKFSSYPKRSFDILFHEFTDKDGVFLSYFELRPL